MKIEVTIEKFENGKVVLVTEDNEKIVWPKEKLPSGIHEGSIINITISGGNDKDETGPDQAKNILNEILNTDTP